MTKLFDIFNFVYKQVDVLLNHVNIVNKSTRVIQQKIDGK